MKRLVFVAIVCVVAAGSLAYGDPIRFDNPTGADHFDWTAAPAGQYLYLDLTLPASAQPGSQGSSAVGQANWINKGKLSASGGSVIEGIDVEMTGEFAVGLPEGQVIPTGSYETWSVIYILNLGLSHIPEAEESYLGCWLDLGASDYNYAWIGVVRNDVFLDAFAWGYETDPGVSIPAGAIPEPGTLALLSLGLVAACRRRHG